MRNILYILFFICSFSNAQYYGLNQTDTFEEREIFDAFIVTPANAANLQTELDNRGTVRLTDGDYSAAPNITLSSNQKLFGYWSRTDLPGSITIEAGATNVHLQNIDPANGVTFEAGAEISNVTIKGAYIQTVSATSAKLSDIKFIDSYRVTIDFDFSAGGYLRNSDFIKFVTQSTPALHVSMIGNDTEPSYGNVFVSASIVIAAGDGYYFENMGDIKIIGLDNESHNYADLGSQGGVVMRDMKDVRLSTVNSYHNVPVSNIYPALDIQANRLTLIASRMPESDTNPSIVQEDTELVTLYNRDDIPELDVPESSYQFNVMKHLDGEVLVNEVERTSAITGTELLKTREFLTPPVGDPLTFPKPKYIKLPTGTNWRADRVGKTDQSAAIQALIDADGIAELDEGIYYISQSLNLEPGEGIVGKGKGKTAIVGITDDFPLISLNPDVSGGNVTNVQIYAMHLTLQGGEKGIYVSKTGNNRLQLTRCRLESVTFADMANGVHIQEFFGLDNNYFESLTFLRNTIGFHQDPDPTYTINDGETNEMTYMDKTIFHNCNAINTGIGFSLLSERPNTSGGFIGGYFSGNTTNVEMKSNINTIYVDSVFENTQGSYVVEGSNLDIISFYGCLFRNNSGVTTVFNAIRRAYLEDCDFQDVKPVMPSGTQRQLLATNTKIAGTLGEVFDGILSNSTVAGTSGLDKLLVKISDNVATTLVDETSSPYPQTLIRRSKEGVTETVNTYDFTSNSHGITRAWQQGEDVDIVSDFFAGTFDAIPDVETNYRVCRISVDGGSADSSISIISPQSASNHYIYAEGSGLTDDGSADQFRHSILFPEVYDRDDGLTFSSKISISRFTDLDVRMRLFYRLDGGGSQEWLLAATSPSSTGVKEWKDWKANILPGDPIELMVTIQNDSRISTWPDTNFIDSGLDDIVIIETTIN